MDVINGTVRPPPLGWNLETGMIDTSIPLEDRMIMDLLNGVRRVPVGTQAGGPPERLQ